MRPISTETRPRSTLKSNTIDPYGIICTSSVAGNARFLFSNSFTSDRAFITVWSEGAAAPSPFQLSFKHLNESRRSLTRFARVTKLVEDIVKLVKTGALVSIEKAFDLKAGKVSAL